MAPLKASGNYVYHLHYGDTVYLWVSLGSITQIILLRVNCCFLCGRDECH
jgi:hypothetical protein